MWVLIILRNQRVLITVSSRAAEVTELCKAEWVRCFGDFRFVALSFLDTLIVGGRCKYDYNP